jgi:hypothetical protein
MKTLFRAALAIAFLTAAAATASAGELKLTIGNGLVTLVAKDVTIREILAEWARVGQTRIVNADKLTGGPVTLELTNVPEAQALDTVLRSAAGYVMAPRTANTPGPSLYDRIMILATSRPPAVTATASAPFNGRAVPQVQQNMPQQDDDGEVTPAGIGPAVVPAGPLGAAAPGFPQPAAPQPNQQPNQQAAPMTAPRPGMLPAPQPAAPNAPPNPYLGTPPGPTAPGFNPNPPPPPPRGPGGGA